MFRTPALRYFLTAERRPAPCNWARAHGIRHVHNINLQRVRFVRRTSFKRRFLAWNIYTLSAYTFLHFVLPPIADDENEEEGPEEAADGDESGSAEQNPDQDASEDSIFIPLGWARPRPRTYYKGTDPEWQEFIKFARDTQRAHKVQAALAKLLRVHMSKINLKPSLGDVKTEKGRCWLEVSFPEGPPLEYERSGIEITDDYIAYTRRPIDQLSVLRTRQALWPSATVYSLYATSRYFFRMQYERAKQILSRARGQEGMPNQQEDAEGIGHVSGTRSNANQHVRRPEQTVPSTGNQSDKDTTRPLSPKGSATTTVSSGKDVGLPSMPVIKLHDQTVNEAVTIFKTTLARSLNGFALEPPRGALMLDGLIEVLGTKARCTVEVHAAYDPKHDRFVGISGGLRSIRPHKQSPKGGE